MKKPSLSCPPPDTQPHCFPSEPQPFPSVPHYYFTTPTSVSITSLHSDVASTNPIVISKTEGIDPPPKPRQWSSFLFLNHAPFYSLTPPLFIP